MNEIVNIFFLAGDTFMPEIHLKQPGFTYSACGDIFTEDIFTEMSLMKLAFNMVWFMEILKI